MLEKWCRKIHERISNMQWQFKIEHKPFESHYFRVDDVYFDKKTKKTWRIIYIHQNTLGDYDLFIRDDKGRVRAVRDYNLYDDLFCSKTKKLVGCVEQNEDVLDFETIETYFWKKSQKLIKANYDNAIVTANGGLLSRHRQKPCVKCGSKNVAEYLYGDDFDADWLEHHLKKGDFLLADDSKDPEKHVFHCKECGEDFNPFVR